MVNIVNLKRGDSVNKLINELLNYLSENNMIEKCDEYHSIRECAEMTCSFKVNVIRNKY